MKITKFLGLSFFLFAFIATSFPEAVHADDAAVLDLFDHEMLFGARYKIISSSTDNTTLAVTASGIFVELSKENEGLPVTFSPPTKSSDSVIGDGNYLTVSFDTAETTSTWMIQSSPTMGGYFVTTEGVDRFNKFMITKSEDHDRFYQLSFCPMCELWCTCPCVPVGVNGTDKNLVPFAGPLLVKFERI